MERRYLPNEECPVLLEKRDDTTPPKIVGRASVFYDGTADTEYVLYPARMDGDRELSPALVERINPRAFNKALSEKQDVRALFNHDPNLVLGRTSARTLYLSKSLRGLDYEIEPGNTTVAKDVQEHIRRGDVTGSSFGFSVLDQKFFHDGDRGVDVREILSVDLFDVSPVTVPAYSSTSTGIRCDPTSVECRSAYDSWKTSVTDELAAAKATEQRLADIKARRDAIAGASANPDPTPETRDADPKETGDMEMCIGMRVKVKGGMEHDPKMKGKAGEVVLMATHAMGVKFDDSDEVHKWYVEDELEPE